MIRPFENDHNMNELGSIITKVVRRCQFYTDNKRKNNQRYNDAGNNYYR